jgi:hypothetical protein
MTMASVMQHLCPVSRVTKPALRGSMLGTLLGALNPVMRVLLDSPLHWPLSRWFAILAWRGRRSGRRYSTPVSFVREGSIAWITTGDAWWHNLEGGAPVDMRVSGRWHSAHGMAVTDRAKSVFEHERLFREHPWFRRLSGIPASADGEPDTRAIDRALEAGRTLVRVELDARSPMEA